MKRNETSPKKIESENQPENAEIENQPEILENENQPEKLVMKITLKKVKMKTSLKKLRSKSHHKNILKKHETANQLIFFFLSKTILKVHLCKAVSFLQKVCSQLLNARVRFKPTVVETLGRLIF